MKPKLQIGNDASYISIEPVTDEDKPLRTIKKGGILIDYNKDLTKIMGIEVLSEVDVEYYKDYKKETKPPKNFKYEGSSI